MEIQYQCQNRQQTGSKKPSKTSYQQSWRE